MLIKYQNNKKSKDEVFATLGIHLDRRQNQGPNPKGQSNNKTIVDTTEQFFSEQGIPLIVRSENGPTSKDKHKKNLQSSLVSDASQVRHTTPEAMDSSRAKSKPRKGQ